VSYGAGQSLLQADGDGLADFSLLFTGDVTGMTSAWLL
jgi:hypothetical protein